MIYSILAFLSSFILHAISYAGYAGIFILMLLESAAIPIPSEVIMPFSGFLVASGRFNFLGAVFAGTFGNLAGSIILYQIGKNWGRPFVEKFGKYFFFSLSELERTERWFKKYGGLSVFFGRILPVVRTYISFPAGLVQMDLKIFTLFTFVGALLWTWVFAYVGLVLGENWAMLEGYFRAFDILIAFLVIAAVIWHIVRYNRNNKRFDV